MFRTHYYLLLKAITTQNYEQLESLTEEKLTLALAAQIYELSVLQGMSFDTESDLMTILDQSSSNSNDQKKDERQNNKKRVIADQVNIVNHMFVRNCSIRRSENPCLSSF